MSADSAASLRRETGAREVVETTAGKVRGVRHGDVRIWRGIPYARAPLGELRFRAPVAADPWAGVRDASRHGAAPPQGTGRSATSPAGITPMSEDCLTVDVTAPASDSANGRPVMVYLYGGAYTAGSTAAPLYDGRRLARSGDVVYVCFNYRLGLLGHVDLSESALSGGHFDSNVGLRDQVAALRWVQENIAAFGGDPARVTVFGESAGAISVMTLLTSPAAEGLFAGAIAQSPAPGSVHTAARAREVVQALADLLETSPNRVGAELLRMDWPALLRLGGRLSVDCYGSAPGALTFAPTVDGDVVPRHPMDVFASGRSHPVPLLVGSNDREGALFARPGRLVPTTAPEIERMFERTEPEAYARIAAAYRGYPGRRAAIDIGGDSLFWHDTVTAAEGHSAVAPTYCYRYDYATPALRLAGIDATHGTELFPVFGALDLPLARAMTVAGGRRGLRRVGERMQSRWTHFAHTGSPGSQWPPFETNGRLTKIIDRVDRIESDPRSQRRRAWQGYVGYRAPY